MRPSAPKILLRSLLISYLFSAVLLLILAFGLYRLKLPEKQIRTAVFLIYVIACFFGGLAAGKAAGSRRFLWGLLSGLCYFLLLFVLSWGINRGTLPDFSHIMTVLACCLAGGTLGGMLS